MNSRKDKEFLEKIAFFGYILHILGGFRGKFCLLGGHFGPGPRQDKDFLVEYTPMPVVGVFYQEHVWL